jgi:hypothetical protein
MGSASVAIVNVPIRISTLGFLKIQNYPAHEVSLSSKTSPTLVMWDGGCGVQQLGGWCHKRSSLTCLQSDD